jgi:hypothetical protein
MKGDRGVVRCLPTLPICVAHSHAADAAAVGLARMPWPELRRKAAPLTALVLLYCGLPLREIWRKKTVITGRVRALLPTTRVRACVSLAIPHATFIIIGVLLWKHGYFLTRAKLYYTTIKKNQNIILKKRRIKTLVYTYLHIYETLKPTKKATMM